MSKSADAQIKQQQEQDRLRALRDDPEVRALAERLVQKFHDEAEIDRGCSDSGAYLLALHRACLSLAVCERDRNAQMQPLALSMLIEMKGHCGQTKCTELGWFAYSSEVGGGYEMDDTLEGAIRKAHAYWMRVKPQEDAARLQRVDDCYRYLGYESPVPQSDVIAETMRNSG